VHATLPIDDAREDLRPAHVDADNELRWDVHGGLP
jgi:hypothetical protein